MQKPGQIHISLMKCNIFKLLECQIRLFTCSVLWTTANQALYSPDSNVLWRMGGEGGKPNLRNFYILTFLKSKIKLQQCIEKFVLSWQEVCAFVSM